MNIGTWIERKLFLKDISGFFNLGLIPIVLALSSISNNNTEVKLIAEIWKHFHTVFLCNEGLFQIAKCTKIIYKLYQMRILI